MAEEAPRLKTLRVVLTTLKSLASAAKSDDALAPVAIMAELRALSP